MNWRFCPVPVCQADRMYETRLFITERLQICFRACLEGLGSPFTQIMLDMTH